MTKQEEIDRLLKLWADDYCLFVEKTCEHRGMYCFCCSEKEALKCLKERLSEQGVVLKVKCPDCEWSQFAGEESVGMTPCHSCNSTGYLIEPLIEEGK